MLRLLPRAILRPRHLKCSRRSFHDDTATLVNLGADGRLVTTQYPIIIGEPHEAYVMIPVEVGRAFQAVAATHQSPGFRVRHSEIKRPLWFFHETKHFAHGIEGLYSLRKSLLMLPVLQSRILAFRDSKSLETFPGNLVITKAQRRYGWMAKCMRLH
jgi:hypothetical protein